MAFPKADDSGRLLGGAVAGRMVDRGHLWAGGLTTAIVAQLEAAAGMLLSYGVLGGPVITATRSDDPLATGYLMGSAVLATLSATLLLHLLLLVAPEPLLFFGWIGALVTLLMVGGPLLSHAALPARVGTALLHLAIGVTVTVLLTRVATGAIRPRTAWIWQQGRR
jgi:hypothetical protein